MVKEERPDTRWIDPEQRDRREAEKMAEQTSLRDTPQNPYEFIQVAVRQDDERLAGHLYRLNAETVRVLFSAPNFPVCGVGETVALEFTGSELSAPLIAEAMACFRSDNQYGRRYEFSFLDWKRFWTQLPRALQDSLNQRAAPRLAIDPTSPIEVGVLIESKGIGMMGSLEDISPVGLAVRMPRGVEKVIANHEVLTFAFALPSIEKPINVPGRIRNRRLANEGVVYGVSFEPGPQHDVARPLIERFVRMKAREGDRTQRRRIFSRA